MLWTGKKNGVENRCGQVSAEGSLIHLRAGDREGAEDRQDKEDDLMHFWAGECRRQTQQQQSTRHEAL